MTLLSGMRIGLLTASASRLGGGVFEAVVVQSEMISEHGGQPMVFALKDAHSEDDRGRFGNTPVKTAAVSGPAQIGYSPELLDALLTADLDVLHLHGIWMYPSRAGMLWRRKTGRPYVISPHGMLDPWITARGKLKKQVARMGYERASWQSASAFHALTLQEAADIQKEADRSDSVVIPNAGPDPSPPSDRGRSPNFIYIGRIHPKKNIEALIDAWQDCAEALDQANATLTIAGWGEKEHVADLEEKLRGAPESIKFVGPLYGEAKNELFKNARFMVLPSFSEGLPMVILEAWAAGTPTLMSANCNLPEGFQANAAIECGYTAKDIAPLLRRAIEMPADEWLSHSHAALDLAHGRFASQAVAENWTQFYLDLVRSNILRTHDEPA